MTIIDRLLQFIEIQNISINKFAQKIEVSNAYFAKQKKNNANIGSQIIEKIVREYKDLNLEWLITGEGQMIKNNEPIIENKSQTDCYLLIEKIKSLEKELLLKNEQIDSHRDHIETLKKQLTDCNNDKKFLQTSVFTQKNIKV